MKEEQLRLKKEQEKIEQEKHKIDKKLFEAKKEQAFEDLLSGKTKAESEKSLQDLFREFYSKTKSVDAKEYVNKAKTSLNSFSSILEKRRKKFTEQEVQKKDEAAEVNQEATKEQETINKTAEAKSPEQETRTEQSEQTQEQQAADS